MTGAESGDDRGVTRFHREPESPGRVRDGASGSRDAGRVLTYEHLLQRVWGEKSNSNVPAMRTIVSSLRRKLGDDADSPTYIFTEPRVGYRMPKGEAMEQ